MKITVREIGDSYRLFVGDWGVATWPPGQAASEEPKAYAEEVARCIQHALDENRRSEPPLPCVHVAIRKQDVCADCGVWMEEDGMGDHREARALPNSGADPTWLEAMAMRIVNALGGRREDDARVLAILRERRSGLGRQQESSPDGSKDQPRCGHVEEGEIYDPDIRSPILACTEKATHFSCCHPGDGVNSCVAHKCRCCGPRLASAPPKKGNDR